MHKLYKNLDLESFNDKADNKDVENINFYNFDE